MAPSWAIATGTPPLEGTGLVTLIHAVPNLVADVSVDGKKILTGFTSSRVTDPVTLSAGPHTVSLTSDSGATAGKTVLTATFNVVAGATETAVVGLTPDGKAKAFVFPEMPMVVPNGQAGVIMRDVAATGPVNLVIDGSRLASGPLASGASATTTTNAGTHHVLVQSTGGSTVLGLQSPTFAADRVTTLYLAGSQKDSTLTWIATTRLASSVTSLSAIPTGDGSTLGIPMTARRNVSVGAAAAIASLMGLGAFAISRRRARSRALA